MNSLQSAEINIKKENPNLPMRLKFDVSDPEVINTLLKVEDLTLPTEQGKTRNIIGFVYDSVLEKLKKYDFPDIQVIRKKSNSVS